MTTPAGPPARSADGPARRAPAGIDDADAGYRVLVVDDEPIQLSLVKEVLTSPRFLVEACESGARALERIHGEDFDVVLLDKRMPVIDGDTLCRRIREQRQRHQLPILMVTGASAQHELQASLAAGATDFIRKPYAVTELVARVVSAAQTKRLTDQMECAETLLYSVARLVEAKDECTGDHCSRLAVYGEIFGRHLGLTEAELAALHSGAVLHDIGKIAIPDRVLLKPGKLTADEWVIMKQHTTLGAELCAVMKSLQPTVPIIRHHHERWDGSGYPDGLAGDRIPYLAQVFQLVDVYDALTSVRPYKSAWSVAQAAGVIQEECAKGFYNPALVGEFLGALREHADQFAAVPSDAVCMSAVLAQAIPLWQRERLA
ncbi:MAG: HD-GYP domain-containing protein [Gammaproteobacteria bacterium]